MILVRESNDLEFDGVLEEVDGKKILRTEQHLAIGEEFSDRGFSFYWKVVRRLDLPGINFYECEEE